jgi:hypothetical protein
MTSSARRERQQRERVEERGESINPKTRDRRDERKRDPEAVRRKAYREQPAFLADAARLRRIAHEPLIVRRIEKHTGEGDRDENPAESVDNERRRGTVLREDVLANQRCWERDDPDGDQQHQVQVEKSSIDAPAMFEQSVVIHPDDADREEAHEVGGIRWPQPEKRSAQISRVLGYAQLEYEEGCRNREDAVAECFEPTRAHASSLTEPEER